MNKSEIIYMLFHFLNMRDQDIKMTPSYLKRKFGGKQKISEWNKSDQIRLCCHDRKIHTKFGKQHHYRGRVNWGEKLLKMKGVRKHLRKRQCALLNKRISFLSSRDKEIFNKMQTEEEQSFRNTSRSSDDNCGSFLSKMKGFFFSII